MNIFLSVFCCLLLSISIFSQHVHKIFFTIFSTSLSESQSVFITGSDSLLGYWNPSSIKLEKMNDSTWSKTFFFESGKLIEYKFTLGSWTKEAMNDDGSVPENFSLVITKDTNLIHTITKWKDEKRNVVNGQITGNVEYHYNFKSEGLKPRDIAVWLPPSYFENTQKRYPVLYMHDGQNIFDAAASSFGYEWRLDEVADSLIRIREIEEIIIVAIYNTDERSAEYSHTALGYKYMDFIVNQLKPFIDTKYRTLQLSEYTATGGASLGGLISFMLAWNYPEIFSKAACLSSAFKIDKLNYVDTVFNYSGTKKDLKFYIDIGGDDLELKLEQGNEEMISALLKQRFEINKDLIYVVDNNAIHSEKSWAERVWRPLKFFFGK